MSNVSGYADDYSDDSFWQKTNSFGSIGRDLLYNVLLLYYLLQSENTPASAKMLIMGGLGYFILPIDIIPDFIPVIGYGDDLTVILGVLSAVIAYVTPEIKRKARKKTKEIFGD